MQFALLMNLLYPFLSLVLSDYSTSNSIQIKTASEQQIKDMTTAVKQQHLLQLTLLFADTRHFTHLPNPFPSTASFAQVQLLHSFFLLPYFILRFL